MTETINRTFTVDSEVESHMQMGAMPIGTVLSQDRDEFWVKGLDGFWYDSDMDGEYDGSEDGSLATAFSLGDGFCIHSVPFASSQYAVGQEIASREMLAALPDGTTVTARGSDGWVKDGDRMHRYEGETSNRTYNLAIREFSVRGYTIHSLPVPEVVAPTFTVGQLIENRETLTTLPEGTILVGPDGDDYWVKASPRMQRCEQDGSASRGGLLFRSFSVEGYRIHSLPVTEPTVELVTVPWGALSAGMYVRPINEMGVPIAGLSIVIVEAACEGNESPTIESNPESITLYDRMLDGYAMYQVLPQDALYRAMLAFGEAERERHRLVTVSANVEEVSARVRREVELEWARKMSALNDSAHEYADENDLCSVFDDFMKEHQDLGFTPRKEDKEYIVEVEVTGTIRRSVSVEVEKGSDADTDAIYEAALAAIGISDGNEYSLNYEDFRVTDVTAQDYEEA